MKNLVKVILVGLLIFLFASVIWSKTEPNSTMGSGSSLESLLGGNDTGGECDCIATYNFLTGILTIPCADVGAGNLYSLDLSLDSAGKSGNITLKLVGYSENTECLKEDNNPGGSEEGTKCPEGEFYDEQEQKCVQGETGDMNQECPEGQFYDEQEQKCVQGETGDMNQECPEGQFYDEKLQKCVMEKGEDMGQECAEGEIYDEHLQKCVMDESESGLVDREIFPLALPGIDNE